MNIHKILGSLLPEFGKEFQNRKKVVFNLGLLFTSEQEKQEAIREIDNIIIKSVIALRGNSMKSVCVVCGALFVDGIGFVEKHYWPCRNNYYGENWTREVDDDWQRQSGEIDTAGIWNEWIDTEDDIIEYRQRHNITDCSSVSNS